MITHLKRHFSQSSRIFTAIAVLAIVIPVVLSEKNVCPKKKGNFPVVGSLCTSYFICKNWKPIAKKTCAEGEHFNPKKGFCVWKESYPCFEKPKFKECPKPNGRFLKPNSKCQKYFDCCDGVPKEKKCGKSLLFDIKTGRCNYEELVNCKEKSSSSESSESGSNENSEETTVLSTVTNKISTYQRTSTYKKTSKESSSESTESGSKENSKETTNDATGTNEISTDGRITSTQNDITSSNFSVESTTEEIDKSSTLQELTSDITENVSGSLDNSSPIEQYTIPDKVTNGTTNEIFSSTHDSTSEENRSRESTDQESFSDITPKESSTEFPTEESSQSVIPELTTQQTSMETIQDSTIDITSSYPDISTSNQNIIETILSTRFSTQNDNFGSPDPLEYFVCPEPTGYFPHPYDRHKFIGCVHNIPSIMDCPSNLVYDHKARQCVYK